MTPGIPWQPWTDAAAAELRASGEIFLGCLPSGSYAILRWEPKRGWSFQHLTRVLVRPPAFFARLDPPRKTEKVAA